MWLWLAACEQPYAEAFDWRIDRTLVPGIRVTPEDAPTGTPRTVEALVLSPWPVTTVEIQVCGLRTDLPSAVGYDCLSDPDLVDTVAAGLPAAFVLPLLEYGCAPGDADELCTTEVPLRVLATSEEDHGSGAILIEEKVRGDNVAGGLDEDELNLRIEVVDGELVAGGRVSLQALHDLPTAGWFPPTARWYVDDGELLNTGRTQFLPVPDDAEQRAALNTLEIPADWHGPLRVAVVTPDGRHWTVRTLEVP